MNYLFSCGCRERDFQPARKTRKSTRKKQKGPDSCPGPLPDRIASGQARADCTVSSQACMRPLKGAKLSLVAAVASSLSLLTSAT